MYCEFSIAFHFVVLVYSTNALNACLGLGRWPRGEYDSLIISLGQFSLVYLNLQLKSNL